VARVRVGGSLALIVRKRDLSRLARRKAMRAALSGVVLLGACLNPRPEELPSNAQLEPGSENANDLQPNAATSPTERDTADSPALDNAPSSPEPTRQPAFAPPEPSDAGALDAGDVAADAG
jgi:hypothetical protein